MKRLLMISAVSTLLWGCVGPIDYLNTTVRKATKMVSDAKAANAEKLAPYEFWSAVEYLHMSKEKAAYADYEKSWYYGRLAFKMGELAKKLAAEKGEGGPNANTAPPAKTPVKIEKKPEPAPAEPAPAVIVPKSDASGSEGSK